MTDLVLACFSVNLQLANIKTCGLYTDSFWSLMGLGERDLEVRLILGLS